MRLVVTNDGVYGVDNGKGITWFYNPQEACQFGKLHKSGWLEEEFFKGLYECIKYSHDVAEFGIYGTLMYTTQTEEEKQA